MLLNHMFLLRKDIESEAKLRRPQYYNIKVVDIDTLNNLGENHFTFGGYQIVKSSTELDDIIEYFIDVVPPKQFKNLKTGKESNYMMTVVARWLTDKEMWDIENNQMFVDIADVCDEKDLFTAIDNINYILGTDYKVEKVDGYMSYYCIYEEII